MPKIGIKQLAEELNVDVSTVSRALRNDPRVKPATIKLVQDLANKRGYRPNTAARALKGGRTGRVAVLLSPPQQRFASPVFLELLSTLDGYLRKEKMSLTVFAAQDWDEELEIVRSVVDDKMADAIVLGRTRNDDPRIRYLLDRGTPFVTFGRSPWPDEHSWVEIDYEEAGQIAVSALAEGNPSNLTIVSASEGLRFAHEYARGAVEEARVRGIQTVEVRYVEMSEAQGERLADKVLHSSGRSAFACIQDSLAFGFYRSASKQNLKIGQHVALFGGQNFPGAEHCAPPLSTYSTQDETVADLLSRVMLQRLGSDGSTEHVHHTVAPMPLLRTSHLLK